MTRHELINPRTLGAHAGFAHAVVAAPGRTVYLAGQTARDREGHVVGETLCAQFDQAAANVVEALTASGAETEDVVSIQIFVTDVEEYRAEGEAVGAAYRRHFGRHFPAMSLFEVARLYDREAKVELVCIAVLPEASGTARAR